MLKLTAKKLTAEKFSPYGDVIDFESAKEIFPMNFGLATRYSDLAEIDVSDKGGKPCISLVKSRAIEVPFKAHLMEYHPHGSQIFYPLCQTPFLILVAKPAQALDESKVELFISNGKQGINFYKNVWHHYLMPLENDSEFLIIDRKASDENCVQVDLKSEIILSI